MANPATIAIIGAVLRRAAATVPILVVLGGLFDAAADPLIVQGSTTFNRRLMEPFQADIEAATGHQLTVIPNKSTLGLIGLIEGRAHMAMISAPLAAEIAVIKNVLPGLPFERLQAFEISRTRVAFAINKDNPVHAGALKDIARVMKGEIANWKALGGLDLPIRVVMVGGGGGVTLLVEAALLGDKPVRAPNVIYVNTPVQLVQVVQQERGAIGLAQLGLVRQKGVPELVTDRPLEQALYFVTYGEPTPAMRAVIDAARTVAARAM